VIYFYYERFIDLIYGKNFVLYTGVYFDFQWSSFNKCVEEFRSGSSFSTF
jgi:hypothetical protein